MKPIQYEKVSTSKYRLKRFSLFLDLADSLPSPGRDLRILDLGGEEGYWADKIRLFSRPVRITLLNLQSAKTIRPEFESLAGSACSLPQFPDNSFDVVHSNSVIEHVGRWQDMKAMAREVRRLAPSYFVQTPYFWFPVEPHFRSLFFHWWPEPVRAKKLMLYRHGFVRKARSLDEAMRAIQGSVLLDRRMLAELFPDSRIVFEKFYGMPKSLMAIRQPS